MTRFVAVVLLSALAAPAAGQQKSARPDAMDPAAPVPPVKYVSPFAGYAPYREQDVASWRDVNDEVARAGGHAGIFRDRGAHPPAKPAAKPAAPAAASTAAPRPGHRPDS